MSNKHKKNPRNGSSTFHTNSPSSMPMGRVFSNSLFTRETGVDVDKMANGYLEILAERILCQSFRASCLSSRNVPLTLDGWMKA
jgi:hypothetical protein